MLRFFDLDEIVHVVEAHVVHYMSCINEVSIVEVDPMPTQCRLQKNSQSRCQVCGELLVHDVYLINFSSLQGKSSATTDHLRESRYGSISISSDNCETMAENLEAPMISLLDFPKELRLIIYRHLFVREKSVIKVEPSESSGNSFSDESSDGDDWRMPPHSHHLSSQILRSNKQIYAEGLPLLYSIPMFDCTTRDGVKLLTLSVPESGFHNITSLIIDWDQLLDFSFQLAKPSFVHLTANLSCITMAHWRTRILGGSSMLWRDVKSYERTVVQSSIAILEKSAKLALVAQHHWIGKLSGSTRPLAVEGDRSRRSATSRIKWRFLARESQMWKEETRVDLENDMAKLTVKGEDAERSVQSALDPF